MKANEGAWLGLAFRDEELHGSWREGEDLGKGETIEGGRRGKKKTRKDGEGWRARVLGRRRMGLGEKGENEGENEKEKEKWQGKWEKEKGEK